MERDNCIICKRIDMIEAGINPYYVAELETGYVVIGDHQYFKGYTLYLCKEHKTELHFLDENYKVKYLTEMSLVAQAVYNAFKPEKLNYELLGNGDTHLHWHIFPRRENDTPTRGPVWWLNRELMFSKDVIPDATTLADMKKKLYIELEKITDTLSKGNL